MTRDDEYDHVHTVVAEVDKAAVSIAADIRKTADELQQGKIHPAHAANRLRKIADKVRKQEVGS